MPATWIPGVGRLQDGQIVNTPIEQANADAERDAASPNEKALRDRVDQAVTNLEQAYDNWANLTDPQKFAAMRTCIRVTAGLARLTLRKLDSAG